MIGQREPTPQAVHALEQSPVSVAITDLEGTIEYVNAEFCRVTGYSPARPSARIRGF